MKKKTKENGIKNKDIMKNLVFALVIFSCCATACSVKEMAAPEIVPSSVILRAIIEDDCKTSLDGKLVKWEEGDCICVITKGSKNCGSYVLTKGAGTTTASFSGGDIPSSPEYYALYPYGKSYAKTDNKYKFSYPDTQSWSENSFGTKANPMIATFSSVSDPLAFKNVFGLLKLQLKGTSLVKKIVVEDADDSKMLWGKVALAVNGKQGTDEQSLEITDGGNSVTLDAGEGVQLSQTAQNFYIALPPGSLTTGMTVKVYGSEDRLLDSFSSSKNNAIIRSEVRAMPVRDVVPDLSSAESANCYIVYSEGKYRFRAVEGNSSTEISNVSDAVLLWETFNTRTTPAVNSLIGDVAYDDGYVTFTTKGEFGNAVIAVRDNSQKILWSWHIWMPGSNVIALPRQSDYLMDRNLGAIYGGHPTGDGIAQIGLLYQWGRKDPFTSCSVNSASGSTTAAAVTNSFTRASRTAENGTLDFARANPQTYIYCPSGTDTNQDWLVTRDNTLWAASKTKYDPCPPGYHVPAYTDWNTKEASFYSSACFGADVKYYSTETSWFPAGGYRFSSDGTTHHGGKYGSYWSYNVNGAKSRVTRVNTSSNEIDNQSWGRSTGASVRCIAATAPPSPVDPFLDEPSVSGTVTCSGNPVQGVTVSDGVNVSVTDADGRYELISKKKLGYVFISVPSGYKVASETGGTTPQFFKYTTKAYSILETIDFEISEQSGQDNFKILALGDIQVNKRCNGNDVNYFINGAAGDIQQYVNSHSGEVLYGLTVGDLAWNDFWYSKNFFLTDFKTMFNGSISGIQFYQTPGNHENDRGYNGTYPANELQSKAKFRSIIGPSYYSTNIGKWHIVILDNVCIDAISSPSSGSASLTYGYRISGEQLQWLQKDLENVASDTPLLISMHANLYYADGTFRIENGGALVAALGGRRAYFVTGHTHYIRNVDKLSDNNTYEMNIGSVCGSVWDTQYYCDGLGVCSDGSAPGYKILDFSGKNLSWEYKCIGRDSDHQFRVYDRNQIQLTKEKYIPACTDETLIGQWDTRTSAYSTASSDNTIIINVYDYDPSWTVEVSEGGSPLAVEYLGSSASSSLKYDPLHLICMEAKYFNRNTKISCDSSRSSTHLFRCTATSANSTVVVKVTTRFGKVHQQTIERPYGFSIEAYK